MEGYIENAVSQFNIKIPVARLSRDKKSLCFPPGRENEILRYAIEAYGHIVPKNTRLSFPEFADLIEKHYTNSEVSTICKVLRG